MKSGTLYELALLVVVPVVITFQAAQAAGSSLSVLIQDVPAGVALALATAAIFCFIAMVSMAMRFIGPVGVGPLAQQWRISPTTAHEDLHWIVVRRLVHILLAAVGIGALFAYSIPADLPGALGWGGLFAGLVLVLGFFAIFVQYADWGNQHGIISSVFVVCGLGVAYAATNTWGIIALGGGIVIHAWSARSRTSGRRRRPRPATTRRVIPRWELNRAAESQNALALATVTMGGESLSFLRRRRGRSFRRRIQLPFDGYPLARMAWLSAVRTFSAPQIGWFIALAPVPPAIASLGFEPEALTVAVLLCLLFSQNLASSLQIWLNSPALRRTVGQSFASGTAALALPMLLGVVSYGVILGISTWNWIWIVCTIPAAILIQLRYWDVRRSAMTIGPFVATPFGTIPVGLVSRASAGVDVLVATIVAVAVDFPPLLLLLLLCTIAVLYARKLI